LIKVFSPTLATTSVSIGAEISQLKKMRKKIKIFFNYLE